MPSLHDLRTPTNQRTVIVTAFVLLIAFVAIYAPAVGRGFIKDDFEWLAHSRFDSVAAARAVFTQAPSGFFRPMVSLSFAGGRFLYGFDARWYGLTNLLLALGCSVGVFALARALALPPGAALLAAAVWAFNWHGINMALLWISGRTALTVVLFATFSAAAFASKRFWLASVLLLLTLLSKEEAVLLPFVLTAWAVGNAMVRRVSSRPIAAFVVGSAAAEILYFFLRIQSGAFTPATAPSFYRFDFSLGTVVSNVGQYLDRTATFATVVVILWFVSARPKTTRITADLWSVIAFGMMWWLGTLAMTVFLPVRSSLYACLPSVGIALVAGAFVTASWPTLSRAASRRAILVVAALPFILWPVYQARNLPLRREAELSTDTLTALQRVATERGAGIVVVVHDDRSSKPPLINPFGGFIQDAANLIVRPTISVWLDPPPTAGLQPPSHVDVELALKRGSIVQVR